MSAHKDRVSGPSCFTDVNWDDECLLCAPRNIVSLVLDLQQWKWPETLKEPSCATAIRSVSLQEWTLIRLPSLSENACRRIVLLGQVPPPSTLTFVSQSRQKGKVSTRFLSENRLRPKLGEDACTPEATIPKHYRSLQRH